MSRIMGLALAVLALGGCSSGIGGLTTGSLFGQSSGGDQVQTADATGAAAATSAAAPAPPPVSPTSRALHVGAITARAMKCGYNFDPNKLKAQFIASEAALGTSPADMANVEKAYNTGFNGVNKVASSEAGYCNDKKTKEIKEDLTRALAGDFSPRQVKQAAADDEGFFGGLFSGGSGDKGPAYGSQEWWDAQNAKAGN